MPRNGIKKVIVAFGASFLASGLSSCGLLPGMKELQPPPSPSTTPKGVNDRPSGRSSGAEDSLSPKTPSSPTFQPEPVPTPIPGAGTPPIIGPSQPQVKCTFQLECINNGNVGVNFSGFCLDKKVASSVSVSSLNGAPVFPQCPQVRPIFMDALPTGKSSTTVEGGATLKASCDGTNFAMLGGGLQLQMAVPQVVCEELRDRINALKL